MPTYKDELKPPPPPPPKVDQFEVPDAEAPEQSKSDAAVVVVAGLALALIAWKLLA